MSEVIRHPGEEIILSPDPTKRAASATMMRLLAGAWVTNIIHTAAELGIADHFDEGPRDAASLAGATATHLPSLARLLRALTAIGLLLEAEDGRYTLTPLGDTLRTDAPGSMAAWARFLLNSDGGQSWQGLTHSIRTGETAFHHVYGTDVWTFRSTRPEMSKLFDEAMQSLTQGANAAVTQHYPFEKFGWIIDVGGGNGALLLPMLERHPTMRGTIFDLPHVIEFTRQRVAAAGLELRCEAIGGDAFIAVPPGADAYLLKSVIHDWDDEEAVAILRNCRAAMPAHAKLVLIERVLPDRIDPDDADARSHFLSDMNMLVNTGGRERTEGEYRDLLAKAGLRLTRVVATPSLAAIIEAEPD